MATVSLKSVWKVYEHNNVAVRNVSLDIVDGEFMVLVGPSGCGKSTTLRMIAGLEDISSGTVEIDGVAVNDAAPRDRDIAMVFQSYALYPHMSVADNMTFALRIRRAAKDLIAKRLRMAADILGLNEYLDRKPRALSGGQRQRVAMGRAIVREPKVFLFDEPLSNLDAKMRVEMRREIVKLHRQVKATMVYVTHDQVEAMTLGDRICVMERGIIRQVGTPGEVFDNPENLFVAGFIGTPPMNLVRGTVRRDGDGLAFIGGILRVSLPAALAERAADFVGAEVVLGLRPKSFRMTGNAEKSWSVVPEFAELLGEEALVHVGAGKDHFIVSLDPQKIPEIEKPFLIEPDMNRAHLFSAETGMNLTLGLNLPGRYSVRRQLSAYAVENEAAHGQTV